MITNDGQSPGGVIEGDLTVKGQITGDASVAAGARLVLHGQIAGSLTIDVGGQAEINGMVTGDVVNRGNVEIRGVVRKRLIDESGTAIVHPGAIVG